MALHIVTSRCFLACDRVTFVKLEERPSESEGLMKSVEKKAKRGRPKKEVAPKMEYVIVIGYYPITTANYNYNNREPTEYTLEVKRLDQQTATALYKEIVKEVQEQYPNEVFLDKLVNKLLTEGLPEVEEPVSA